jgi:hypothetical protein
MEKFNIIIFALCLLIGSPHLIEDIMRFKEYVSGGVRFYSHGIYLDTIPFDLHNVILLIQEATRTSGVTTKQGLTSEWKSILPDAEVLFVSAKTGLGVPDLERKIASKLPIVSVNTYIFILIT